MADIVTVNPDQLGVASAPTDNMAALVFAPGGPLQQMPFATLLAKLIATNLCKASLAELNADLAHDADTVALVFNDPTALQNGWYRKTGASGAGAWSLFEVLSNAAKEAAIASAGDAAGSAGLAGRFANSLSDVDIPGGSPGDRSSRFWMLQSASYSAIALSSIAALKVKIGVDTTGQVSTVYGDSSLNAAATTDGNLYGPSATNAIAGVLTAITGRFQGAGTGELHIYLPLASGLTLSYVTNAAISGAGLKAFAALSDFPANLWFGVGAFVAWRRLTGSAYLMTGAGASSKVNGDTGTIGDVVTLSGVATGVALSFTVLSDANSLDYRITSIGDPTTRITAKLGIDTSQQTSTTYGSSAVSTGTADGSIWGSATTADGVLEASRIGVAGAGTGRYRIYIKGASATTLGYIGPTVTVPAAGEFQGQPGVHWPKGVWLPAGSILTWERLSGSAYLKTGAGTANKITGDGGVVGNAVTVSGVAASVAMAVTVRSDNGTTINARLGAVEGTAATNKAATTALKAKIGADMSAQTVTTYGDATLATGAVSNSNLYGPPSPSSVSGVISDVKAGLNGAGTGRIHFYSDTGNGPVLVYRGPVVTVAAAGTLTLVPGTDYPADYNAPSGFLMTWERISGSAYLRTGAGTCTQVNGDTGVVGVAVTYAGIATGVALQYSVTSDANSIQSQIDTINATINGSYANVNFDCQYSLVLCDGQSLSRALLGGLFTTGAVTGGLKFVGGIRADDGGTDVNVIYASLVPLTVTGNGSSEGENPSTGVVEGFNSIFAPKYLNGSKPSDLGQMIIAGAPGAGATAAASLWSGTYLQRKKDYVTYGFARAQEAGMSFCVPWLDWVQGEEDVTRGTALTSYYNTLTSGRLTLRNHIRTVTGKPNAELPIIMSQVAQGLGNAAPTPTALAQRQLYLDQPMFLMTIPRYQLPVNPGYAPHLNGQWYKTLGEYHSYAAAVLMFEKRKIKPVDVKRAWRDGNFVVMEFWAERGPLVFDTSLVTDPGNYGFQLVDSTGAALAIDTPVTFGGRYVKFKCTSRAPVAGDKVWIGGGGTSTAGPTTGPRCCLRDSAKASDGSTINYNLNDGVGNRPLYFYALMSETVLS